MQGKVKVCKHNTESDPQTAVKYVVNAIPALLFIKDGKEVHRVIGASTSVGDLKRLFAEHCGVE